MSLLFGIYLWTVCFIFHFRHLDGTRIQIIVLCVKFSSMRKKCTMSLFIVVSDAKGDCIVEDGWWEIADYLTRL